MPLRHISFADARQTSGNTNACEGKLLRIKPMANPGDTPGIGTTYTIPGADAPNGAEPVPGGQPGREGRQGQARGVRHGRPQPVLDRHRLQDGQDLRPRGSAPTRAPNSTTWGPAKTENAAQMGAAGNYGWPYCQGGNRFDYRAKLPAPTGGGTAANLSDNVRGTVGGGADGQTGALLGLQ